MNNTLTLSRETILKNNVFVEKKNLLRYFLVISFSLIVVLSVFYVFQAREKVMKEYLLQEYENRLNVVLNKNRDLSIYAVENNSLNSLVKILNKKNKSEKIRFKKIDKIHYIKFVNTQFAASRP